MYYPIMFEPIYKETIWGGRRLAELFGRELPSERVGESWEVSLRRGDMSVVRNGRLLGTVFAQLIGINPEGYMGRALCGCERFPLLVKLIDANADLSVQVHPAGAEAKNEVWYILQAPEGGRIGAGLKPGVTGAEFSAALAAGEVEKYLAYLPVKAGDVVNIPAGTVHSLTAGMVIAEIQQNSDTTYRVYDYNRVDAQGRQRELHIPEALAAINFDACACAVIPGEERAVAGGSVILYCATEYYTLMEYRIKTQMRECSDPDRFYIFVCIDGGCEIRARGYTATVAAGDSVFIPAALGEYEIIGEARLLKAFVPTP